MLDLITPIIPALITSLITAVVAGYITFRVQLAKLKEELRTEFMAEKVINKLLNNENWLKRSFAEIKKRIGGFTDDELRKLLVKSGAVRFYSSDESEKWGLISRNKEL